MDLRELVGPVPHRLKDLLHLVVRNVLVADEISVVADHVDIVLHAYLGIFLDLYDVDAWKNPIAQELDGLGRVVRVENTHGLLGVDLAHDRLTERRPARIDTSRTEGLRTVVGAGNGHRPHVFPRES